MAENPRKTTEEKTRVTRLNCNLVETIRARGDFNEVVSELVRKYDADKVKIKMIDTLQFFMFANGKKSPLELDGATKPYRIDLNTLYQLAKLQIHPEESYSMVLKRLLAYEKLCDPATKEKMLFFTTYGCVPCKYAKVHVDAVLKQKDFTDYVDVTITDGHEDAFVESFGVWQFPTILFLDIEGDVYYKASDLTPQDMRDIVFGKV